MRRSLLSTRVLQAAAKGSRPTTWPQTPFICSACQASTSPFTRLTLSRKFSIQSSQRQSSNEPRSKTSSPPTTTSAPTHYDMFAQTFPSGPPPHSPFSPDLKALRKEFLQLQAKAHPDRVGSGSKSRAEALSAQINEAYKTLQDPLRRARYLLWLRGIDVDDESAKLAEADAELLMTVMEAREAVDEANSEEELDVVTSENDERVEGSIEVLSRAFADEQWDVAAAEAVKLRYWLNIRESIAGWEKGSGGGNLQH